MGIQQLRAPCMVEKTMTTPRYPRGIQPHALYILPRIAFNISWGQVIEKFMSHASIKTLF